MEGGFHQVSSLESHLAVSEMTASMITSAFQLLSREQKHFFLEPSEVKTVVLQ